MECIVVSIPERWDLTKAGHWVASTVVRKVYLFHKEKEMDI